MYVCIIAYTHTTGWRSLIQWPLAERMELMVLRFDEIPTSKRISVENLATFPSS